MLVVLKDSLEHRILSYAYEHYPITASELTLALGVSEKKVMMALRRMEIGGLVELDVLPDKVYVRLLVIPKGRRQAGWGKRGARGGAAEKRNSGEGGADRKEPPPGYA